MENRFLDFALDQDISKIQTDAVQGCAQENLYQIFLGSTCNGTCVTCGPMASSAWRSLLKQSVSIKQEMADVDTHFQRLTHEINWSKAKRINLLGGEPLLISRSSDVLERLLEANNAGCRVSFVTNGSVTLSAKQIDLFNKFSNLTCCVSIDGVGKTFEYIRYPLTWQAVLDNLATYRDIFSEVVVSFTVSNLNYYEKPNILAWFDSMSLRYIENYVTSPTWFNYQVVPDHDLWPRFVEEIAQQDKIKGIRIRDYLPYIADMIDQTCR
jgi:MoaA/NifB/PqqE/SkfB family radical SAM enzyme